MAARVRHKARHSSGVLLVIGGIPYTPTTPAPYLSSLSVFLPLTAPAAPRWMMAARVHHKARHSSGVTASSWHAVWTFCHMALAWSISSPCNSIKKIHHIMVLWHLLQSTNINAEPNPTTTLILTVILILAPSWTKNPMIMSTLTFCYQK